MTHQAAGRGSNPIIVSQVKHPLQTTMAHLRNIPGTPMCHSIVAENAYQGIALHWHCRGTTEHETSAWLHTEDDAPKLTVAYTDATSVT